MTDNVGLSFHELLLRYDVLCTIVLWYDTNRSCAECAAHAQHTDRLQATDFLVLRDRMMTDEILTGLQFLSYRGSAHGKGEEVGERGDGDGCPCSPHGQSKPLRHGPRLLILLQIVKALHCHEHVIDS